VTVRLRADRWSEGVEYLNPDDIARDRFGDWNSPDATLQAARWTTERREALLAARQGIAFETVFSTEDKLDFLIRASSVGAIDVADRVYIYDNSVDGVEARLCARTTDGRLRKVYGALPEWIGEAMRDLPRHPQFVDLRVA
jgi:predicted ABC-type ATPase